MARSRRLGASSPTTALMQLVDLVLGERLGEPLGAPGARRRRPTGPRPLALGHPEAVQRPHRHQHPLHRGGGQALVPQVADVVGHVVLVDVGQAAAPLRAATPGSGAGRRGRPRACWSTGPARPAARSGTPRPRAAAPRAPAVHPLEATGTDLKDRPASPPGPSFRRPVAGQEEADDGLGVGEAAVGDHAPARRARSRRLDRHGLLLGALPVVGHLAEVGGQVTSRRARRRCRRPGARGRAARGGRPAGRPPRRARGGRSPRWPRRPRRAGRPGSRAAPGRPGPGTGGPRSPSGRRRAAGRRPRSPGRGSTSRSKVEPSGASKVAFDAPGCGGAAISSRSRDVPEHVRSRRRRAGPCSRGRRGAAPGPRPGPGRRRRTPGTAGPAGWGGS